MFSKIPKSYIEEYNLSKLIEMINDKMLSIENKLDKLEKRLRDEENRRK